MADPEVAARKAALRGSVLAARRSMGTAREQASDTIADAVVRLPEVWRVRSVMLYAADPDEVDLTAAVRTLVQREAVLLYPRVAGDTLEVVEVRDPADLVPGHRDILEPVGPAVDPATVDAIVVPGVAFDLDGGRLGRGGGHYDRLLAVLDEDTTRIGVAFSSQVVPVVPRDEHDQPVDIVVTEHAVHQTGARRTPRDA